MASTTSEVNETAKMKDDTDIDDDEAVKELARDYASYLEVDTSKEVNTFNCNDVFSYISGIFTHQWPSRVLTSG